MEQDKIICPQCGKENDLTGTCEYCGADLSSEVEKFVKSATAYMDEVRSEMEKGIEFIDKFNKEILLNELPTEFDERIFAKTYDKFTGRTEFFLNVLHWRDIKGTKTIRLGASKFDIEYVYEDGKGSLIFVFWGNDLCGFYKKHDFSTPTVINLGEANNITVQLALNGFDLRGICNAPCLSIKRNDYVYEDENGILRLIFQAFYNLLIDHEEFKDAADKLFKYAQETDGIRTAPFNKKIFEQSYNGVKNTTYTNLKLFREKDSSFLEIDETLFDFEHIKNNKMEGFHFSIIGDEDDEDEDQVVSIGERNFFFPYVIYKEEMEILCEAPMLYIQKGETYFEDSEGLLRNIAQIYYNAFYNNNRYTDAVAKLLKYKREDAMNTFLAALVLLGIIALIIWLIAKFLF